MRVLLVSLFCSLFFVACNNTNSKNENIFEEAMEGTESEVELVGADVDSHGCKRSAGYIWSQLRDDCIRVFDEGITLLPVNADEKEPIFAAFVLYNEDKSQIELFLPSEEESILLEKKASDSFEKDSYSFEEKNKVLYIDGNAEYMQDGI